MTWDIGSRGEQRGVEGEQAQREDSSGQLEYTPIVLWYSREQRAEIREQGCFGFNGLNAATHPSVRQDACRMAKFPSFHFHFHFHFRGAVRHIM